LRKIAERTVAGLLAALDACAAIFKPTECANYFKACGYDTGSNDEGAAQVIAFPTGKNRLV